LLLKTLDFEQVVYGVGMKQSWLSAR
jgi:hypothetical protein